MTTDIQALSQEARHALYKSTMDSLSITQGVMAKWMYHRDTATNRKYVSRKYCGSVAITFGDLTLIQSMQMFKNLGFDLTSVAFTPEGKLSIKRIKQPTTQSI